MVSKNVLAASITSAPDLVKLGKAGASEYAELIMAVSNRHIGGSFVYLLNTPTRDLNLIRNPMMRRYSDYSAAVGDISAPRIGEAYDPYEGEFSHIPVYLDQVGGSLGFYWDNGYKKVVFDTGGRLVEHSGTRNEVRMAPIYDNIRKIYEKGVYGIRGSEESEDTGLKGIDEIGEYHPYFYDINRDRYTPDRLNVSIHDIDGEGTVRILNTNGGPFGLKKYAYGLYNEDNSIVISEEDDSVFEIEGGIKRGGLLSRTAQLFREGKINSLVSRFYTDKSKTGELLSRGRMLQKAQAGDTYGGYYSPYARTWTAVHQYGKYKDTMSYPKDPNGNELTYEKLQESLGGMRTGKSNLHKFGVMSTDRITPRIAPSKADEIKRCMFSIENLAWRDIKFDAGVSMVGKEGPDLGPTLSAEQRGPNGGRIMWFPPYGLNFTENISTRWESNTFIGRGENIYTYTNTERRGTLDFILLVDHPSRVDLWRNESDNEDNVEQLLRYFAGENILLNDERVEQTSVPAPDVEKSIEPTPQIEATRTEYYAIFFPNNYSGVDDDGAEIFNKLYGVEGESYEFSDSQPCNVELDGTNFTYWIDWANGKQVLKHDENYHDSKPLGLNDANKRSPETNKAMNSFFGIPEDEFVGDIYMLIKRLNEIKTDDKGWQYIITVDGFATSHGESVKRLKDSGFNKALIENRRRVINKLIEPIGLNIDDSSQKDERKSSSVDIVTETSNVTPTKVESELVSDAEAKFARSCFVRIEARPLRETPNIENETIDQFFNIDTDAVSSPHQEKHRVEVSASTVVEAPSYTYDNEYLYFKDISESDSPLKKSIVSKVKYFDPAYHSITPEGFNARLTFLQQCTRQGPTNTNPEKKENEFFGAGNLAFGRPPFCILRIGDFYNTKICIDTLNISYETEGGVQWDLNRDGIGVQPMYAKISINFTFLGGQDISGPISRLQNAASYNFYANTSVYDVRSDYRDSEITWKDNTKGDRSWAWSPLYNGGEDDGNNLSVHREWGTRPETNTGWNNEKTTDK